MRHVLATAGGALLLGGLLATPATAATELSHEASLDDGVAEIRVSGGPELAGEEASVLVLAPDAALAAPAAADVVHIDQRALGEDGTLELRVALPSGELDGYWLAVNTSGSAERYVAPLDGEGVVPTEEPTEDPTDEPTTGPGEQPTEEPTGGPGGGPDEEPTGAPGEQPAGDGPSDGSVDGAGGGTDGGAGSDRAGGGGTLSRTGAPLAVAAGVALLAVLAGGVTLAVRRRA